MFARKEVQEEREAAAAKQWQKAKRSLRGCGLVAILAAIALLCAVVYLAGEVNGRLACNCRDRAELAVTR